MLLLMNYELAKQLNDLGFPYRAFPLHYFSYEQEVLPIPNLLDLIHAFDAPRFKLCSSGNAFWWATADWKDDMKYFEGATPEEAVAKLWLALHQK